MLRSRLRGLIRKKVVYLPVGRDDFHHLHTRLAEAVDAQKKDAEPSSFPAYRPVPLDDAEGALQRWLSSLRRAVDHLPIEIEAPSTELLAILRSVARAAEPHNENEILRLLGALTGGVFVGPHTFHLDVANACNVNCKYCWFHSPLSKNRKDAADFDAAWRSEMVDWEVFTSLVNDLHALGTREDVLLSGKGEPLLHPRCLDMVAYIKERGMGVTLFSNGILVREEARQALVEHGADLLYVSLSSASPAVYEAIHPGHEGSELDEVRDNVLALTKLKEEQGSQVPRVMMVDVLCRSNAHEALDFYEQARDLGAEHVRFQLIHVQDYNRELALLPEQIEPLRTAIAEAQRRAENGGPTVVPNIHYQLETIDPVSGKWGNARTPDEGCYVGWSFSRSWTNGDVSFCCSPKVVEQIGKRSFKEIWQGEDYGAFRGAARDLEANGGMTFRNGAPLLGEHCSGCPNYEGIGKMGADLKRYGLDGFVRGSDGDRLRALAL
ncbi:MAG: radical SAM protein [Myxococcota bacterium]|nr:radical SAM protein [Myxococcota bacterium]